MLVPLSHAERNAFVQLIFGEALWRGVHHADKFVIVTVFLVAKRSWVLRMESHGSLDGVGLLGEVVHLLRKIG